MNRPEQDPIIRKQLCDPLPLGQEAPVVQREALLQFPADLSLVPLSEDDDSAFPQPFGADSLQRYRRDAGTGRFPLPVRENQEADRIRRTDKGLQDLPQLIAAAVYKHAFGTHNASSLSFLRPMVFQAEPLLCLSYHVFRKDAIPPAAGCLTFRLTEEKRNGTINRLSQLNGRRRDCRNLYEVKRRE